jgi:hypothetical protein
VEKGTRDSGTVTGNYSHITEQELHGFAEAEVRRMFVLNHEAETTAGPFLESHQIEKFINGGLWNVLCKQPGSLKEK